MTEMQNFFFSIFQMIPDFLMSPPIIYFVAIAVAIYVAALMITLYRGGKK